MGTSLTGVAAAGGGWQLGNGNPSEVILQAQGAEVTYTDDQTLVAADLVAGIVIGNVGEAENFTLPTVALLEATVTNAQKNLSFDFTVQATGGAMTILTATGWTLVGYMVVAQNTAVRFRARKTGVGTWTLYRFAG